MTVNVSGLKPGSKHAAHVHGPLASCAKRTKRHAAELGDFVADDERRDPRDAAGAVEEMVVGMPGYFVMVHANPGKKMPKRERWR